MCSYVFFQRCLHSGIMFTRENQTKTNRELYAPWMSEARSCHSK